MPPRAAADLPPVAADILIEAGNWPPEAQLRSLVDAAIAAAVATASPSLMADAEVSVVFTDDGRARALNHRYRGKDAATNVLSFPAAPIDSGRLGPPLGDIVLAFETVAGEAATANLALGAHITHLIVHGFLHLLGYDHTDEGEASAMERLETAILSTLGVADPYAGG